jgi:hypothetical protein
MEVVMVVLVLPLQSQAQLPHTLAVAGVDHILVQAVVAVLVEAVAQLVLVQGFQELSTLEVAVVVLVLVALPAVAVQALSFFATPAQFNISLVAQ